MNVMRESSGMEGPVRDVDSIQRGLYWRLFGSVVLTGSIVGTAYFLRPSIFEPASVRRYYVVNVLGFVIYIGIASLVAVVINRRLFARTRRWLLAGAPPDESEGERLVRLTFLYSAWSLIFWLGALIWIPAINIDRVFPPGGFPTVRFLLGQGLGAFLSFFYCFLLIDRALRPLYERAPIVGDRPMTTTQRLSTRLVLLWISSGAAPAVSITLVLIGTGPASAYTARTVVWTLCGLSVLFGSTFAYVAARTITTTVAETQSALRAVASGDLNVHLAVDNPTELGHLQAGFNNMVDGLRERRLIEDLFGRHVGTEVARYALAQGTELRGETRNVSVLFVDIIGSSRLAQSVPPTDVVELLNRFFGTVVRVLGANGGWVNKFEGDGALGIFGAPADQPDHAARALKAARELRTELDVLERDNPQLRSAIGVSSGAVVAGNVGAAERYEYGVIGDPVNEASRVTDEAKTREQRVLATLATVEAGLEEQTYWRSAGEVELRGREGTTRLYEPHA